MLAAVPIAFVLREYPVGKGGDAAAEAEQVPSVTKRGAFAFARKGAGP